MSGIRPELRIQLHGDRKQSRSAGHCPCIQSDTRLGAGKETHHDSATTRIDGYSPVHLRGIGRLQQQ